MLSGLDDKWYHISLLSVPPIGCFEPLCGDEIEGLPGLGTRVFCKLHIDNLLPRGP